MESKFPKNAKLVFEGRTWSIYQWEERMFDGSRDVFEGLRKNIYPIKIIATIDGEIAFSQERQPGTDRYYSLFGGGAEGNEKPLDAAKRELLEESGLTSEDWELFTIFDVTGLKRVDYYVYVYLARNCRLVSAQMLDKGEEIKVVRANFSDFIRMMLGKDSATGNEIKRILSDQSIVDDLRLRLKM